MEIGRATSPVWDDRGTTAIEFALVGPLFLMLLIGTIYMSMMLFSIGSLNLAVQQGARCASVQTTTCTDSASTIAYSKSHYYGIGTVPTFTATTAACGKTVTASATYTLPIVTTTFTIPINVSACFP